ncbi:DUF1549 and DUF1553 domain-containing protein [Novipirellula sp. SH528]|uniref:DUF1549 and DUF1553 domain-containing protein n=1 Tax=Novipirellula sp. SH528 TaxID=3454466 RepID=UPI003FA16F84
MTHDLTSNPLPDDSGQIDDDKLSADDDSGLAVMLSDAFDAPPVPKTLVRRLDEGIAAQWGESPELASSRLGGAVAVARSGTNWLRTWPLAAGVAAAFMIAFVLSTGSNNHAWAAVVDAIKRQGLIQIEAADGMRWLDLSNLVVGRQTESQSQWVDVRKRSVLTRLADSDTVYRTPLEIDADDSATDLLLTAFLLDQPLSSETLAPLRGIKLIEQKWEEQTVDGRDIIELHVRFQTAAGAPFSLSLQLDPESNLPLSVQSGSGDEARLTSLAYSDQSLAELQSSHFPNDMTIVDTSTVPVDSISSLDDASTGNQNESHPRATDSKQRNAFVDTLPIGPAKKWVPVAVVSSTDAEVLERINTILDDLWQREEVRPVDMATDLELLRRAYLDLAGRTPTVTEVRRFLQDQGADRYERLVDQLLSSPDHASQLAAVWRSFLIPEGVDLDAFGGREAFEKWLSDRFAASEPYDQIVRKLLLAEGRLSQSGPLLFYSALKLDADQLAARTSRVFLGMRLECAQCHDHPFEPWTQEDFWSYAAFFAQISRPKGELENVSSVMRVSDVDRGDVMLPETETIVPPRFLGQPLPPITGTPNAASGNNTTTESARRQRLAAWLTGPNNPYFARATVNRVWAQLLGRGIVDPVDDFGVNNPPVSPELLDTLASQFIDDGFDLQSLIRSVVLSNAYRLSSSSQATVNTDEDATEKRLKLFAQMNVKTLTAEQLYDCISVATMLGQDNAPAAQYTLARFGNSQRDIFLQQFATPAANRAEYLAGIPQALMLMNGSLISGATSEQTSGLIRSLEAPFFTDSQRIDVLFMATLSRPATEKERELLSGFIPEDASPSERSAGLADVLWALINSAEFTLNH